MSTIIIYNQRRKGTLQNLRVKSFEFLFDSTKEDAGGIVDGIIEYRILFLLLRDKGVMLVKKFYAGNDHASKEGKFKYTYQAAEKTVYPTKADSAKYFRNKPTH